jgi:hypothetical protein
MNPSSGETKFKFEVPQTPATEGLEEQHDKKMEQTGHSESAAGKQQPAALNSAVLALPTDIPTAAPVTVPTDDAAKDDKATQESSTQLVDHDSNRIEKVWVDRAKKVISQTRDNPHAQKQGMSEVKAEYIRMRFNKTIPTDGAKKP